MKSYKAIIFDLDDTLIKCNEFYQKYMNDFVEYSHIRTGITKTSIMNILKSINDERKDFEEGFSRNHFPRSFKAASIVLDIMLGNDPNMEQANTAFNIANRVFEIEYPLIDGVYDTLKTLAKTHKLLIWTKGDIDIQTKKILKSDLGFFFNSYSKDFTVVPRKTPNQLKEILKNHHLTIDNTLLVGDNYYDEIACALEIGMNCLLVDDKINDNYSHLEPEPISTSCLGSIRSVNELPQLLNHELLTNV